MIKKVVMIVKYSIFGYLIGEGFRNFFKNKKSTAASIIIMCATMFIFGIFFLIGENINYIMEQIQSEQAMQVFIDPEATPEQEAELEQKIKSIQYVNTTEYVSKEQALNDVKSWSDDINKFLSDYTADGYNPFKASYVITLTDLTKNEEVQNEIRTFEHVADIEAGNQTVNKLVDIANGIRTATAVILVLLVLISIFIIANTIKLTVHARRKEISIMKYVGATNGFIRWPFMVEGIIIGIVSALISVVILGFTYNFIVEKLITSSMVTTLQISLLTFSDMLSMLFIVYIIMGIGIGAIGSAISMKKYLEV
jgi:cell division transport system permease protein